MSTERRTILRHAATVLAGQLAVMAFGVTDTIVAGRHAEASLAPLSIGSAIFVSVYVALMGLLQALLPVWAEQRGAQNSARIGASVRQALYVCAIAALLGMSILLSPGKLLEWTDVPPELRPAVTGYLAILAMALPPALLFFSISALAIWVIWISTQTGIPAKPAANVAKLAPGFVPSFSPWMLGLAPAATVAWCALVAWRTGRHRAAIWKSLVLPASGATLEARTRVLEERFSNSRNAEKIVGLLD